MKQMFEKGKKCNNCKGKTFGFGSLVKWAKIDNPKKYEEYKRIKTIMKVIDRNKKNFPNNDLTVSKVEINDHQSCVQLMDKFCPISKKYHDDESIRFMLFSKMVTVCFVHIKIALEKPCLINEYFKYEKKK